MKTRSIAIICMWAFLIALMIISYFGEWDLFFLLIAFFIITFLTSAILLGEKEKK